MASFLRSTTLLARATRQRTIPYVSCQPARFAHSSYGDSQSGHQKSDAASPQVAKEHPGPEAPADKGIAESSSSSGGSPSSTTKGQSSTPSSAPEKTASDKSTDKSTSSGAKPALLDPKQRADTNDPEVKKHNEDMRNRADQTPNQVK